MKVKVPYGEKDVFEINVPTNQLVGVYNPNSVKKPDAVSVITEALAHPIASVSFDDLINTDKKIVFIVNDGTRPTPTAEILKIIYPKIKHKNISFIVATGVHRAPTEKEYRFISKQLFYQWLNQIDKEGDYQAVLDGMIMAGLNDFWPELVARDEADAISVLQKAGFYKDNVCELVKSLGLHNWNKVASCSIASRFPYYTHLTPAKIKQVMQAEKYLRNLGFPVVRVRYHNEITRIEVPAEGLKRLVEQHIRVQEALASFGFKYVTVNMAGFKSGRMNDDLSAVTKQRLTVKQK